VVGRPARRGRLDAFEAEIGQIERVDKAINHTNGIALLDPLIEAFRQQRRLSAIGTLNEALHDCPRQIAKRIIADSSFSRSQGHVWTAPDWQGLSSRFAALVGAAMCPAF